MQDRHQLMVRYQQLRKAGNVVAMKLSESMSKEEVLEGARKLGLLNKGAVVLESGSEMPILMDFCIHEIRREGRTAVDRLLAEAPYPAGSGEAICLEARRDAYFSLFAVESREPKVGAHARDLVREESVFIHDVGLSESAVPGLVLATRVYSPDNILMTTGAAMPFAVVPESALSPQAEIIHAFKALLGNSWGKAPEIIAEGIAAIIRTGLEHGAASSIVYRDIPGTTTSPMPSASTSNYPRRGNKPPPGVDVYDPCPCGSGKKFKFCCGARR